jgi:hypothetical protein
MASDYNKGTQPETRSMAKGAKGAATLGKSRSGQDSAPMYSAGFGEDAYQKLAALQGDAVGAGQDSAVKR